MIVGLENIFLPLAQLADLQYQGGVGNIVSATLQTKGLIDQAAILTTFKPQLEWIAAAAWLFSICMGIGAVAVFGSYRQATYLLLGPPLFYYMITTPLETNGVRSVFGDREEQGAVQDQSTLLQWAQAIDGGNTKVNVSFFFGVFDSIVTEVVQKIVAVMLDTKNQADLRFVARETALSQVLLATADDEELAQLVHTYHLGVCGDAVKDIQEETERNDNPHVQVRPREDIEGAKKRAFGVEWTQPSVSLPIELKNYLIGLKPIATQQGVEIPYQVKEDEIPVSCKQVWDFTRVALLNYAQHKLNADNLQGRKNAGGSSQPLEEAVENVKEWLEEGAKGDISADKILAAFIYKNMRNRMTPSFLQSQVFSRAPTNTKQYEAVFGTLGNSEAYGGYMKIQYFARSIPYIQGLLLYLLCIAFPFFSVFLVLPGKAPSFLVWCSLWVWVKSWDIGFAVVHVARDIFWHMMKHRVNFQGTDIEWSSDPSSILRFAFQNDPLFSQNTYWIIISVLTLMVPAVTAHFCLGATGMFDMFKGSIDQSATRFGNKQGNRARRHEANISEAAQDMIDAQHMREGMEAHSRDTSATTMNGTPLARQDKRKGFTYGLLGENRNGQLGVAYAVNEGHFSEGLMAGRNEQFAIEIRPDDYLRGGRESSMLATHEAAEQNAKINEEARLLEGKISNGTASNDEKSRYGALREEYGYDNEGIRSQVDALTEKERAAKTKDSGVTMTKEEKETLDALRSGYMTGPINLPTEIPHIDRGMLRSNQALDRESMQRVISDEHERAQFYRGHGRENDAVRHEQRAAELQTMLDNGQSITRAEHRLYERSISNAAQDVLTVSARRRQYRIKRGLAEPAMGAYLNARQGNMLNAKSFFDHTTKAATLPGGLGTFGDVNRAGGGVKIELGVSNLTGTTGYRSAGGDED